MQMKINKKPIDNLGVNTKTFDITPPSISLCDYLQTSTYQGITKPKSDEDSSMNPVHTE